MPLSCCFYLSSSLSKKGPKCERVNVSLCEHVCVIFVQCGGSRPLTCKPVTRFFFFNPRFPRRLIIFLPPPPPPHFYVYSFFFRQYKQQWQKKKTRAMEMFNMNIYTRFVYSLFWSPHCVLPEKVTHTVLWSDFSYETFEYRLAFA